MTYGAVIAGLVVVELAILKAFKQHKAHTLAFSAKYYDEQGQYQVSRLHAEEAYRLDKFNDLAMFYMGNSSYRLNNIPQAVKEFGEANYLPHKTNQWRALGLSLYQQKKFAESAEAFKDYLTVIPNPQSSAAQLYIMLGSALMNTDSHAQAAVYLSKAVGQEPANAEGYQIAIKNAIYGERPTIATFYYDAFRIKHPEMPLNVQQFLADSTDKTKMAKLVRFFTPLWANKQDDVSAAKILAAGLSLLNKTEDAEKILKEAKAKFPQDSDIAMLYGDNLFKQNRRYDAKAEYERHLTLRPDSPFKTSIQQRIATLQ